MKTIDGNEAAASVAYRVNEVMSIYPITPSSPMGELADAWSAEGRPNIWGTVPRVIEMQSEAGAAGTLHGTLQAGALATTFTASQGLLLMIPNLYKIAGELLPTAIHVAARTVATHALSIFADHSDVMSCRATGMGMLAAAGVQEAHDMALIATAAAYETRVPFIHFFDGFRTSHEVASIEEISDDQIRSMIDDEWVIAHRNRRLDPDAPVLRGTAQNPDVFFQAREAINPFYEGLADRVQSTMDTFYEQVGRRYHLFDYVGHPEAQRVIVMMGSGIGAAEETVTQMVAAGERVGLIKVRLYRPFRAAALAAALPASVLSIGVLDRTKEPGAVGEPLYQDVVTSLAEETATGRAAWDAMPRIVGGRFGLSSKEFTPAMVQSVFENLGQPSPKQSFTVGIHDDVSHSSLPWDDEGWQEPDDVIRCLFYGLGADGTVGANKNTVKIVGENADMFAQGFFVYDSKKSGAMTISHLRFSPRPISSTYLIREAQFVAIHDFEFLRKLDVLAGAAPGATLLINTPYSIEGTWDRIPVEAQQQVVDKRLTVWAINAYDVAEQAGLGRRVNTVLQTCFFHLSQVIPEDEAIGHIKAAIAKSYGRFGEIVVERNERAVDAALAGLHQIAVPGVTSERHRRAPVPEDVPDFVERVTARILAGEGDLLPVSALPVDGTFPTATTKYEKRSIALEIPIWDPELCIECAKCTIVCPHTAIQMKVYEPHAGEHYPKQFQAMEWTGKDFPGHLMTIQVAPEDCTGCGVCVDVCPAKSKEEVKRKAIMMRPKSEHLEVEKENFEYFLSIPQIDRSLVNLGSVKGSQMLQPLFEFSGACSGCGETPYLKLMTQLFGDRVLIANATGCSSIYGGNLPTTPWSTDANGRGPTWANSLFEDNAEFGLGMRLALDQQIAEAERLVLELADQLPDGLAAGLIHGDMDDEAGIADQRALVEQLDEALGGIADPRAARLASISGALVRKSVWIVGGDGWAYDIGFGGLDHVMASGRDVNILVLDTEVYSNTGGQASKATPRAAVAKFAAGGKEIGKKDLGMIAAAYGNVYVAQIAVGANNTQTVKAMREAESFPGPSLIIAYSQCIAHGIDMETGMTHQKEAVDAGYWPLYRFDPRLTTAGKHAFHLDSRAPKISFKEFAAKEARYAMLERRDPEAAKKLFALAQEDIDARWELYSQMADLDRTIPDEEHRYHDEEEAESDGEETAQ